jgi:hypothetical protein
MFIFIVKFFRLGDCSHMKTDRYHASLLKSTDLPTTPLYAPQNRTFQHRGSVPIRPPSPPDSYTDSNISLAKVTTIPRCRDSITSTIVATPQLKRASLAIENPHTMMSLTQNYAVMDETKMNSLFEPIAIGNMSPAIYADAETRKNGSRLPLEAVPEMNELDVAHSRYSFDPTLPISQYPRAVQPSPVLITFDSNSLKRRS